METIAAEVLISRLADWGVDTIFGLPGDGINGIMEGLRRNADRVRFVLVHHEEAAAFMASAYAKSTGRLGVCLATSGSSSSSCSRRASVMGPVRDSRSLLWTTRSGYRLIGEVKCV